MIARRSLIFLFVCSAILVFFPEVSSATINPSYSFDLDVDTVPFFADGTYDQSIPHPNDFLKHPLGSWPLRYNELVSFITALDEKSDRVKLKAHGITHEGRRLYNLFISSPENIARLGEINAAMNRLADPLTDIPNPELNTLLDDLPAVCWLGFSIHGDEVSGVDAGAFLAYQLAAGTDEQTQSLLDNLIVIIDPIENPDGRERYLSMLQSHKSQTPNYDAQSLQHNGVWPGGRTNHYLFDLNRDWILLRQPETKGKVRTIVDWHPQLVVDAHEMGSNGTFLMSPPREPVNYNTPGNVLKWYDTYNKEQASAFDERAWPYYSGEWNDQWYPGYGSAWATFFGAVGILYEQAGVDGQLVRQEDGYILSYHEAVNHQFTSAYTNLATTAAHRREILKDYRNALREIVAKGRQSGLKFVIAPSADEIKTRRFVENLLDLGISVDETTEPFRLRSGTNIFGEKISAREFPAGSYIVGTDQAHGALARAILEFDPHLNREFLEEERRELEKHGQTRMYEISTWSLPLGYDMDAAATTSRLAVATKPAEKSLLAEGELHDPLAQFGFIIDMVGEKTYLALTRLYAESNITLYVATKPFSVEDRNYNAGAILIRHRGNSNDLPDLLEQIAAHVGIDIYGVSTGRSTDGSLLGAPTFRHLIAPRIGIVSGSRISWDANGSTWFMVDQELGLPHSLLSVDFFHYADLSPYNVLIIPSVWGNYSVLTNTIGKGGIAKLKDWVKAGGVLICTGQSAAWAADTTVGLSQVKMRSQALDEIALYMESVERERNAEAPEIDTTALWHPEKAEKEAAEEKSGKPAGNMEKLEEHDRWLSRFFPRGVYLRADVDTEDWLAFDMEDRVPVMFYGRKALLAKAPVTTVARFADENNVRVSGLLWPEGRERWANTAYVTRERMGKGLVILFAEDPDFRVYQFGTRPMLVNAILFGPGLGSAAEEY